MRNVVRNERALRYRNEDQEVVEYTAGTGLTKAGSLLSVVPSGITPGSYWNGLWSVLSTGQLSAFVPGVLFVSARLPSGAVSAGRPLLSSIEYQGPNPGYITDATVAGTYTAFTVAPGAYFVRFSYRGNLTAADVLLVEKDAVAIYQGDRWGGASDINGMCFVTDTVPFVITFNFPSAITVTADAAARAMSVQIIKVV